ncbi:MAG: glycosyltransferase family 2 protein [Marinovum sp.]|nr:glycosyltransferase family 2 protein [Marinovum sp.]
MQSKVAALTMVRSDAFFLKKWLRHYGTELGRENCYVVSHGRGEDVAELAQGCNIIGIPGDPHPNFDQKRWTLLNNILQGLRSYYDHIIVGDVDELVVVDPAQGQGLLEWVSAQPVRRAITPVGVEVIHRVDLEDAPIDDVVLGPRRFIRHAPHYSKPSIVSCGAKISRGGHFMKYDQLHAPEGLYLFHLKFSDFNEYAAAMDRRNATTTEVGVGVRDASIGRHWFTEARGEDREVFDAFAQRTQKAFDFASIREAMHSSFRPRGDTGFYEFARADDNLIYELPERFFGVI